jgi:cbb3-type cytochrome oxidase subunit 3
MKLSDIMSNAGLTIYAEVALILFVLVFAGVLWRVFSPSRKKEYERASRLPLDEEPPRRTPTTTVRKREE